MHEKLTFKQNQRELGHKWFNFLEWETFGEAVKKILLASILTVCAFGFVWALSIIY